MPALHRALALTERQNRPVRIGEHLDLDVARPLDELLDVDGVVTECARCLAARGVER
jgi:hypothetical protein